MSEKIKLEVGKSSAGDRLKRRWSNGSSGKSLKAFVRDLAASGDEDAKEWLFNKQGGLELGRSDKSKARIAIESQATRLARKRVKASAKKATTEAPAAK